MTIVKQEYCCVRPMRYKGYWTDTQGGSQHEWSCDRCGEKKRVDVGVYPNDRPGTINYAQHA